MATYKKKLLDSKGNVILPYTRAELVYNGKNTVASDISSLSTNLTSIANLLNSMTNWTGGAVNASKYVANTDTSHITICAGTITIQVQNSSTYARVLTGSQLANLLKLPSSVISGLKYTTVATCVNGAYSVNNGTINFSVVDDSGNLNIYWATKPATGYFRVNYLVAYFNYSLN